MARNRGERVKVYVTLNDKKYGFLTQQEGHNTHKAALGHTAYAGAAGVFFGCNSPKPPRATYDGSENTFSSFCSTNKVSALKKTAGWTVNDKTGRRGVKTSGRTRTVYVDMPGGWKYAWNLPTSELDIIGTLGIVQASGADAADLVWGVQDPKPPRASRKTAAGTQSTFAKPQASVLDAAAAAGFTISGVDYDLIPNP
ncbi:hypothetical protein [Synechocystis sp. LKSZ1]|uniref:hypothetical protein n=1 Tax=Synechocystis sp. LKSZ1 TaxID=3144951 RepID=UPI00336C151C